MSGKYPKCECVDQYGPNPDCGKCGGDGTYGPVQNMEIDLTQFKGHTESLVVCEKWGQVLLLDDDGVIVSNVGWIGTNDRIEADARLFAAAPALLEEVKRLSSERDKLMCIIKKTLENASEYLWDGYPDGDVVIEKSDYELLKAAVESDKD